MKLHSIALNSLRRRKAKLLLLVFGLAIAVGTVVALRTLSESMNAEIGNTLDEYGANIVIIPRSEHLALNYGGLPVSDISVDVQQLTTSEVSRIRTIKNRENIKFVAPKLLSAAMVLSKQSLVVGVDFPQEVALKKWWTILGEAPVERNEALLGSEAVALLGLARGQSIRIEESDFIVTGVLEETGSQDDRAIFIDLTRAQELFGKKDQVSMIEVAALCYDCPIEEIVAQTSDKLPNARVMAIRQTIESRMQTMQQFDRFSFGVSIVVLLVAAIIVWTNIMASINERTREIGIFRAIGYRSAHVVRIILLEVFLISGLAGIVGYAIGRLVSLYLAPGMLSGSTSIVLLDPVMFGIAVLLSVGIGLVASLYPAVRASHLDPTIALKSL